MPRTYFAAGASLDALVNLETVIDPFHVLDGGRIPSLPPVKARSLDGIARRDGKIVSRLVADAPTDAGRIALNQLLFGNQTTASAERYISALDDTGHYSPYRAVIDRPYEGEDYTLADGTHVRALVLSLFDCRLQSVTKNSSATLLTTERLVYVDTSGGDVTITLYAAASIAANTVVSFIKTAAGNSLVLDGDSAETINGNTTLTVTATGARVDLISDGVSAWRTI